LKISSVYFGIYDDQELVKLSVKEITNPIPLDDLLNPTQNGLYDPALGPFNPGDM
jgi:DNA-directed RNA polymerase I subunit RPA1